MPASAYTNARRPELVRRAFARPTGAGCRAGEGPPSVVNRETWYWAPWNASPPPLPTARATARISPTSAPPLGM
jgi:hypothetical protein